MRVRCCWTKWSAGARCMWLAGAAVEFDHVLAGLLPAGSDGEVLASPTMIVESCFCCSCLEICFILLPTAVPVLFCECSCLRLLPGLLPSRLCCMRKWAAQAACSCAGFALFVRVMTISVY